MSRKRGEASLHDDIRRSGNPLCMYNNLSCEGSVTDLHQTGFSFGRPFETTAVVCEAHYRLLSPNSRARKPKEPPAQQLKMSL